VTKSKLSAEDELALKDEITVLTECKHFTPMPQLICFFTTVSSISIGTIWVFLGDSAAIITLLSSSLLVVASVAE
jgi:hypothetical protein